MIYNYEFFVSYAHKDNEDGFVTKFVERLRNNPDFKSLLDAKPRVFFDKESFLGGDAWKRRIKKGIKTSRFLIVLLSPSYFQSEMCAIEFDLWLKHETYRYIFGEGIMPIQIDDVPGLFERGVVDVPKELQIRFPRWVSELGGRQRVDDFDLRKFNTRKIKKAISALCVSYPDKVWKQDSATKSQHNYSYPNYNEFFVGRREELGTLRSNLEENNCVALHGLGGVGKTGLAVAYGHAFAWDYQLGRIFINCENQTSLISAILGSELVRMTKVELQGDKKERLETLFDALRKRQDDVEENKRDITLGKRLLLILDNVTNLGVLNRDDLDRLTQTYEFVHIIVTTLENPEDFGHICRMPLAPLKNSEALELLRGFRPFEDDAEQNAALEIIEEFDGHPFRMELIGAYLRCNTEETYQSYLEDMQERGDELDKDVAATNFPRLHKKDYDEECLRPTLEKLKPNARKLLEWAALFGPDSVPVPWLGELAKIDGADLRKGLQELKNYRLLIPIGASRLSEAKLAHLHRIARKVVIKQMPDYFPWALEQIGEKIDELLSKGNSYWLTGDVDWGLDSIADFCYAHNAKMKEQEPSNNKLIWRLRRLFDLYLYHLKSFDHAHKIGQDLSELTERWVSAAPNNLEALSDQGCAYCNLGDLSKAVGEWNKARDYYKKALDRFKKIVERAGEDVDRLRLLSVTYIKLADFANEEGDCEQARDYYEKALEGFKKIIICGGENPQALSDLSGAYGNLGSLLKAEGDYKKAREHYEKALKGLKKVVKQVPDNLKALSDLSITYSNLGNLSKTEGDYKKAREYFEMTLEGFEEIIKQTPDDFKALYDLNATYNNLGDLSEGEGDSKQAREYYEKALEGFKKIITRVPNDLNTLYDLGSIYTKLGCFTSADGDNKQAREYFEKALGEFKKIITRAPNDLKTLYGLGSIYTKLGCFTSADGDNKQAREYFEKAAEIWKKARERKPDDSVALRYLGKSYNSLGNLAKWAKNYDQAREYYEKAVEIREKALECTPDDSDALRHLGKSYNSLGNLAKWAKNYDQAREYYLILQPSSNFI